MGDGVIVDDLGDPMGGGVFKVEDAGDGAGGTGMLESGESESDNKELRVGTSVARSLPLVIIPGDLCCSALSAAAGEVAILCWFILSAAVGAVGVGARKPIFPVGEVARKVWPEMSFFDCF